MLVLVEWMEEIKEGKDECLGFYLISYRKYFIMKMVCIFFKIKVLDGLYGKVCYV